MFNKESFIVTNRKTIARPMLTQKTVETFANMNESICLLFLAPRTISRGTTEAPGESRVYQKDALRVN